MERLTKHFPDFSKVTPAATRPGADYTLVNKRSDKAANVTQ